MDFKYFSSVEGRAVQRYGTDSYIGTVKTVEGFVWDINRVVAIPVDEWRPHGKSYARAVRGGDLRERSQADFEGQAAPALKVVDDSPQEGAGPNEGDSAKSEPPEQPIVAKKKRGGRRRTKD